jgi:hypothetical protein
VSTVTLNCKLIEPNVVEGFEKSIDVLKKALTRVLEDGDDSYEFVQARIDTINDELFTDEYNVARYLDAFNKKLNLYCLF